MSSYSAPLHEIRFTLHDVLGVEATFRQLGYEDAGRETVDAILEEGARFCESVLAPLNQVGDRHGVAMTPTPGASPPRPASRRRTRSSPKAAGAASPRRPSTAAWACPTRSGCRWRR